MTLLRTDLTSLALCALIASACDSKPTPGPSASPAPSSAAPAVASSPAAPASSPAAPHRPATCEVEITGNVRVPPRFAKEPPPMVFVAIGDCLAENPKIVGFAGSHKGKFFVEVFVPWGSDLTICAAVEPTDRAPSKLYGKSPLAMHAEAAGEVEFKDVVIEVAPGPAKVFEHYMGPPK